MAIKISVLAGYFLIVLFIGLVAKARWKSTPESYFLADRGLGTLVLLGTMVATNFSAFTVFGTSGAGYRDGYAFFPIMGFGTGFMALTFWILGRRIWKIGRDKNLITPPELIGEIYHSRGLSFLFAVIMIVFTIPYLALQPMAAGYVLEELIGLPYGYGCSLVTAVIVLYTLRGGLRAVAWTDLFQGSLMVLLLLVSLVLVSAHHGGFIAASQKALALFPDLFSRPGGRGTYTLGIWFSYMLLWFFCDPMFPQLFQRFFSARSERSISRIMLLYPLICSLVFFMPIAVGVLGRLSFPGLEGRGADRILPMVITRIAGDGTAALVMAAGLAALMSTMDSQLLTLSSLFTRDIVPAVSGRKTGGSVTGRLAVVCLGMAGLALAWKPPATILQIATQTFTGLAVLFPSVLFGLYFRQVFSRAAIGSIVVGEGLLLAFYLKKIPSPIFLPVVWIMGAAFGTYLLIHVLLSRRGAGRPLGMPGWGRHPFFFLMAGIFLMAMDFWAWGRSGPILLGVPLWTIYFMALSGLQTGIMAFWVKYRTP